jgi:sigma-54 dependent transcriptional regulator, acetoin dehydrogenase operon transcriptional activator AcoR
MQTGETPKDNITMNKHAISPGTGRHLFATGALRHPLLSASVARTEAIVASHERSRAFGLRPKDSCDFASPLISDFKISLESSARLYAQAQPVMELLLEQVLDTGSIVVLADNKGTILRTLGNSTFMEQASRVALRPGICWAEASKGTNAVGTALMLESEFIVHSNEHFINSNHFLTCSAAPIMDHSGNVVGVLDVSGDERSFHPHTLGLVKMSARTIENYWFCDNFSRSLRLHFHSQPELIGTVAEGIIAIGAEGKVLGVNRAGLNLLSTSSAALRVQGIGFMLGLPFDNLMDQLRCSSFTPLKLQCVNGKVLYAKAHLGDQDMSKSFVMTAQDHAAFAAESPAFSPSVTDTATLRAQTPVFTQHGHSARKLHDLNCGDVKMQTVIDKVQRALDKNISIMIWGETGTGKEWLANAIHNESRHRSAAFVAVDCASIPEHLIESELFGSVNHTPDPAKNSQFSGKLLQANGGTLFLDEIGDMPLTLQARLLRVLQERRVTPSGSSAAVVLDVQIICSTHRNVRDMVNQGTFRDDLYYRLNGLVVKLPPLRERSDFKALCQSILNDLSPHKTIHLQAGLMQALEAYAWPGNLRQLRNALLTGVSMCSPGNEISLRHLSEDFHEEVCALQTIGHAVPPSGAQALKAVPLVGTYGTDNLPLNVLSTFGGSSHLHDVEVEIIRKAVQAAGGNISKAAKQLNISRNTVYRKLKSIGI